jgi:flagellin
MSVGANKDEVVKIPMCDLRMDSLSDKNGNLLKNIDLSAPGGVDNAIKVINGVIHNVLSINSKYGALENRLDSSFNNLNEISDRMEGADSSLRDADIAEEMMEFSKDNILAEAGTALMAQTNKLPQDILRILENMRR